MVERLGPVTVLTFNRPASLNAFDDALRTELTRAMAEFDSDPDQYVAVLTGSGHRAFSAGADLFEMASEVKLHGQEIATSSTDVCGVGSSAKPTIAAVNGLAVGEGMELSLNCDIRIAAEDAWFGLFEVTRGIMPGIAANLLTRIMPMGEALFMILTGDRLSAQDAFRLGLVQKVVASELLLDEALRVAKMIANNSQTAVQASKHVVRFWRDHAMAESLERYHVINRHLMCCEDVQEGISAFVQKRAPTFTNRWPSYIAPIEGPLG